MKPSQLIGKLIAILLLGIIFGGFIHHDRLHRSQMSRDEYVAYEGARYDRLYTKSTPAIFEIVVAIVMTGLGLGLYELLAFGCSKTLKGMDGESA